MYKIIFHFTDGRRPEVYGGGTYTMEGEKYAILDAREPKLYKSPKVARNCAEKLRRSCANLRGVSSINIVEVEGE